MGAIMRFAGMELDPAARQLRDDTGANVHVEQQVFDVLLHLVEHRDRVVPKTELLDTVWGHRFVTESTLTSRIKSARRAVGDSGDRQEVIRTVRGVGYQLAAEVDVVDPGSFHDPAETADLGDASEAAPTGTVTFLFTDVEGSTGLWERHPAAMEGALAHHDEILRDTIVEHGGYVFSTAGDAFSAAFGRARVAVAAAQVIQERLGAAEWPDGVEIRVRMGLHTGEAQERDGDYFGPTLSRAARLMTAGWGGQVLLSDVAARLVSDVELIDLGVHRLKDLGEPERLWQLGTAQFPPPRVSAAADVRLPEALTSFHGRAVETEELVALLSTARLVTLLAPGGMGKTRLAVHAAARTAEAFPGGVWFASLAEVGGDDAEAVPFALADAIGVRAEPDVPLVATLASWIGARRALLVVDNCEHVRGPAGAIVAPAPRGVLRADSAGDQSGAVGCAGRAAFDDRRARRRCRGGIVRGSGAPFRLLGGGRWSWCGRVVRVPRWNAVGGRARGVAVSGDDAGPGYSIGSVTIPRCWPTGRLGANLRPWRGCWAGRWPSSTS